MHYLLDACALLALLNGEEGDDIVDNLLKEAEEGEITLSMSIVQLLEVYYDRIRVVRSTVLANEIIESILAEPITIIDSISYQVFYEAGRFKTTYKISLADAIACATASCLRTPSGEQITLVTSDGEMKPVEKGESFPFLWIR